MKKGRLRAGAAEDVARLHRNEWGVWHWKPEKRLRPHFKGTSLGRDEAAARIEARRLNREVEAWLKGEEAPRRRAGRRRGALSVSQLANLWTLGEDGLGSDHWRGLRERTRRSWRAYLKTIEAEFGDEPAAQLTKARVLRWSDPLKRRAPGSAASYAKAGRTLFSWAIKNGHVPGMMANPFSSLGLAAAGRRERLYTLDDIRHLVAVADGRVNPPPQDPPPGKRRSPPWLPRPSLGTALVIAFGCVQRATDVLALGTHHLHAEIRDGQPTGATRLCFNQSKSSWLGKDFELVPGVRIDMRLPPIVAARLTAAPPLKVERMDWQPLVVNEMTRKPYTDFNVAAPFRRLIARAIAVDPARWGHLKGMQLRDGRRSGFVHLRRLGLTVEKIVNLSGHTLEEGYAIVEHYMPRTTDEADQVAAMMTGEL